MKQDFNYLNWHKDHAKAWKIMPPPARPSKGEVSIFKKYLEDTYKKNNYKIKVLILGATPEFRDICNRDGFDVTCIDINKPIYESLTLLQKTVNKKEKFINANWLTFNGRQKYNVIIGDVPTAMFPLRFYKQFFQNMSDHLVKNGQLIIRAPYQNPECDIAPKEVFQNYRSIHKKRGLDIYTATFTYLALYYLNKHKSGISLSFIYDQIKELYKKNIILKNEFEDSKKYYKNLTLWLYYPTEKFLDGVIKQNFTCAAKEYSLDYPLSIGHPICVLKPKE